MPNAEQILEGLTTISRSARPAAMAWHAIVAAAVLALCVGWRPTRRGAAAMLSLPLLSAAAFAWAFANPFNGTVLAAVAIALLALGWRLPCDPVQRAPAWRALCGAGLVAFGLCYPHFLEPGTGIALLWTAPVGLIPCPTLSLVSGFALVGDGLQSRAWALTLAAAGLFYGIFGAVQLGVWIDVVLVAGAALLAAREFGRKP